MKSNKVLLGLFVGFMALIGGSVSAQDTNFYELGPDNIGGNVTRLVVDMGDSNGTTVYASAIGGGLFVRSGSDQVLQNLYTRLNKDLSLAENHDIWHKVPYFEGNKESELPINSMAQSPDGTIIIGTGDNNYLLGSSYGPMSSLGRGIYRFNPETLEFKLVPGTKPDSVGDKFAAVRDIDLLERDGVLYVYAVTGTGLYRWVINGDVWDDSKWANCETIFEGTVDQMWATSCI